MALGPKETQNMTVVAVYGRKGYLPHGGQEAEDQTRRIQAQDALFRGQSQWPISSSQAPPSYCPLGHESNGL